MQKTLTIKTHQRKTARLMAVAETLIGNNIQHTQRTHKNYDKQPWQLYARD